LSISITEIKPSIPAPVAAPFPILMSWQLSALVRGRILFSSLFYKNQSKLHPRAVIGRRIKLTSSELIFRDSAFKHNLTEADIRHAFETCCYYIDRYKNRENVYLLLGFDMNANPVEILYNEEDNGINVFHAMPCRKQFFHLFKRKEVL
jgi:hypothetical protein